MIDKFVRLSGHGDRLRTVVSDRRTTAIGLFGLSLVVNLVHWAVPSVRAGELVAYTPPDTARYLSACTASPVELFDLASFLAFLAVFCTVEWVPGPVGPTWVGVQILLVAVSSVVVFDTADRVLDRRSAVVAGVSFAVLYDTFRWTRTVLSDIFFVFVLAVAIWTLVRWQTSGRTRDRVSVVVSLSTLALSRPFGAPIVAGWLLYDVLPLPPRHRFGLVARRRSNTLLVGGVVVFAVLNAGLWLDRLLQFFVDGVVFGPPRLAPYPISYEYTPRSASSTVGFVIANAHHLVALAVIRAGVFFIPVLEGVWGSEWKVWNSVHLSVLLVGTAVGISKSLVDRTELFRTWATPLLAIVGVCSLTLVDASFRYRAPAGVVFALSTGYAVHEYVFSESE